MDIHWSENLKKWFDFHELIAKNCESLEQIEQLVCQSVEHAILIMT